MIDILATACVLQFIAMSLIKEQRNFRLYKKVWFPLFLLGFGVLIYSFNFAEKKEVVWYSPVLESSKTTQVGEEFHQNRIYKCQKVVATMRDLRLWAVSGTLQQDMTTLVKTPAGINMCKIKEIKK